ncbi:MAG: lamin tail domain-containing protein [Thermoplasmatota archaeon]
MKSPRRAAPALSLLLATALLAGCAGPGEGRGTGTNDPDPPGSTGEAGTLRVLYVDVGQGDATIWLLPGGGTVVYDCGPAAGSAAENRVVQALKAHGAAPGSTLQALISSHGHLDHIGGCEEILDEYHVANIYDPWFDGDEPPKSYERFQEDVAAELDRGATLWVVPGADTGSLPSSTITAGDILALGDPDVTATLLWPDDEADHWRDIAEVSLVVRLQHADQAFCFQGDITDHEEQALVDRPGTISCDVYLVGHHGSKHASSTAWLAELSPTTAVVSAGEGNRYGHPTPEAMGRIANAGATLYSTTACGTITVTSDGAAHTVTAEESGGTCGAAPSETPEAPAPGPSLVGDWIQEIFAAPTDGATNEWVRIRNPTTEAVEMTGWLLQDEAGRGYGFPEGFTLDGAAQVRVHTGDGNDTITDLYWGSGSAVWNNSGDTAFLFDETGAQVDDLTYSA